jgi:PAS domain S-box-containing protein
MGDSLSLRERLLLLVITAILPLAALLVWILVREIADDIELAESQLKFAASLIASHQDRNVEAAQNLLGTISAMPQMRAPDRKSCEKFFEALHGIHPVYSNFGIVDLKGDVICHAGGRAVDFSLADRPYFAKVLADRRFVMGAPAVGKVSRRFIVPFAQPVFEGDKVTAIAFAALDLENASGTLAAAELPAGARVVVTDRRGVVVMEYPRRATGMAGNILTQPRLLDAARQLSAGTGEWNDASGEPRIYAFAPSHVVSGEGFLAAVSIDKDQVARTMFANLRGHLLALGMTLLAGLAAAWWLGGRVIVRPARQILSAVRRLERGSLEARVPLRPGMRRGEFARIGAAFNLMAESLQLRQLDLETELGRSRSAYVVLDLVLNGMQDSLIAVTGAGQLLMFNEAAARLFPLSGPALLPRQWAQRFGFFHDDGITPFSTEELPLVRSARGESGRVQLLVRNALVPNGRLLQCSWQPIHGDSAISGGLVVFTDVTELQRLQSEQTAQYEQLCEVQRKLVEAQRIGRVGNWELDVLGGRLWWSDVVYELFGVAREKFDGTLNAFMDCVHPDDRGRLKPARDSALRDGRVMRVEYRVIKPDGIAWMSEIGEARRNERNEPVWFGGVVQDVTARKKDEQALLASERELQGYTLMLQRAAEAAQAITAHPSPETTMQEVADQARRVIGCEQAAVSVAEPGDSNRMTTSVSVSGQFAPGQESEAARRSTGIYSLLCESGRPLRLTQPELEGDLWWRGFAGESEAGLPLRGLLALPLVSRRGQNIGLLVLSGKEQGEFTERDEYVALELAQLASIAIENATLFTQVRELNAGLEARIAERTAELARQERLFRTLAQQAPEVVWNTDSKGRATFLNAAWDDLVGGTPADWLGNGWMQRLHPDDVADVQRNWIKSRENLQPYAGIRRFLAQDGSYHTMSYKAGPVLDQAGEVAFWVGIDTDITELKAIEAALRSSNQELEAFSYSVSHDLRAPLGAIGGFSRALATKLEAHPDDRVQHYLARIEAAVEKMEQLIEDLLSLARVVRAPLTHGTVDLGTLAHETLEALQSQDPNRKVTVQVQEALMTHGDARLLRVVMENLLGNSWKFTSRREEGRIEVGRLPDSTVFSVRDNGVGFDMAYSNKLFGAFQRLHTQSEFPGTGIGLATVRRIITRHQGRIWADSRLGEGTTFFFTLSESAPPAWLSGQEPYAGGPPENR